MEEKEEVKQIKITTKLKWSLFIISLIISLIRYILTYIDKREFEGVFVLDLVYGSLLILSIILTVFANKTIIKVGCFLSTGFFLFFDTIISFFSYSDSFNRDYFSICLFIIIIRIFTIAAFTICALFPS